MLEIIKGWRKPPPHPPKKIFFAPKPKAQLRFYETSLAKNHLGRQLNQLKDSIISFRKESLLTFDPILGKLSSRYRQQYHILKIPIFFTTRQQDKCDKRWTSRSTACCLLKHGGEKQFSPSPDEKKAQQSKTISQKIPVQFN